MAGLGREETIQNITVLKFFESRSMKFAIMSSSCILQQPINQHCKTTYPFNLNELLKINTAIFFFFFLHFSKTMPRPCLLGLGRGDCCCFTVRAVPGCFVPELARLQGHSQQTGGAEVPHVCPALGCCKLWAEPRRSTELLVMSSCTQSTGAACTVRSQAVPPPGCQGRTTQQDSVLRSAARNQHSEQGWPEHHSLQSLTHKALCTEPVVLCTASLPPEPCWQLHCYFYILGCFTPKTAKLCLIECVRAAGHPSHTPLWNCFSSAVTVLFSLWQPLP